MPLINPFALTTGSVHSRRVLIPAHAWTPRTPKGDEKRVAIVDSGCITVKYDKEAENEAVLQQNASLAIGETAGATVNENPYVSAHNDVLDDETARAFDLAAFEGALDDKGSRPQHGLVGTARPSKALAHWTSARRAALMP